MKYKHPDGRIIYISSSHTGGKEWGVFWNSTTGGSHRIKSIPMSADKDLVLSKLDEFAKKNKCTLIDEVEETRTTIINSTDMSMITPGLLDDKLSIIRSKSSAIVQHFIEIGTVILDIEENRLYIEKGYKNLVEMAQKELNYSKTTLYNLISVAKKFTVNGRMIEGYENFNFSQLVELVSVPEGVINKIDPNMPVKEIQKLKKESKAEKQNSNEDHKDNNKRQEEASHDTGVQSKRDMQTCPDSQIMADVPFPNFKCRECKISQSCTKYRDKKSQIEREMSERAGISLGDNGSNAGLKEQARAELQQEKHLVDQQKEANEQNNSQLVQHGQEYINFLKGCLENESFIITREADDVLTQIGQLRIRLIERERQLKK